MAMEAALEKVNIALKNTKMAPLQRFLIFFYLSAVFKNRFLFIRPKAICFKCFNLPFSWCPHQ
jgi:hypothetical protein